MNILTFQSLKLTNFISVGSVPLELSFSNGLNLITGYNKDDKENKNGIGKSTICDGIYFSLFGVTLKDLKVNEIVNDKNKKKCVTELDFSVEKNGKVVEYKITRGIKPSICTLIVDGEASTHSTIPQVNKELAKILGVSKELFKQSIIMSIGKSVSFFSQGKIDKRKFIEGIFDLGVFSEMLGDARKGYNDSKKDKDSLTITLNSEKTRISDYKAREASFDSDKRTYIQELEGKISTNKLKLEKLGKDLTDEEDITTLRDELDDILGKIKKITEIAVKVESDIRLIDNDASRIRREINANGNSCPTCLREYDDASDRIKIIEGKMEIIKDGVDAKKLLNDKLTIIGEKSTSRITERNKLQVDIQEHDRIHNANKLIESHITSINEMIDDDETRITKKEEEISGFGDLITESMIEAKSIKVKYDESVKSTKVFDVCKFVLSEEGVKSAIINRLKVLLNVKINEYLDLLGSVITCEFDEYFVESIYNEYGTEKSYDAFSGGESKRIDLAILLTFQDILKSQTGVDIRLGLYDEILDSSIDEIGRQKLLGILKDRSKESAIYIISHRGKMSDLIDKEIVLEKHNDFTFLQEII